MLRTVYRYLFHSPDPADSILVRLAMFLSGALSLVGGLIAAVQLHVAALIMIPFGFLLLWAWWLTAQRRFQRARELALPGPRLTRSAVAKLTELIAQDPYPGQIYVRLSRAHRPGIGMQPTLSLGGQVNEASERTIDRAGLVLVIAIAELEFFATCELDFAAVDGRTGFVFRRQQPSDA